MPAYTIHCQNGYYTQHVLDNIHKSFTSVQDKLQYSRKMPCCGQQKDFYIISYKPEHMATPYFSNDKMREKKPGFDKIEYVI
jgi:hypothetical protein